MPVFLRGEFTIITEFVQIYMNNQSYLAAKHWPWASPSPSSYCWSWSWGLGVNWSWTDQLDSDGGQGSGWTCFTDHYLPLAWE